MECLCFNSLVICNDDRDKNSIADTLTYFNKLGVRRFIITYSVDPATTCYSHILARIRAFRADVMSVRPRGCTVKVLPSVDLSNGVLKNPIIQKLSIDGTHVFIRAPLFVNDEWLPPDINYLLYKQKLKPIFLSFERNLISSTYDFGNKLYKTQSSHFCMDIKYLTDPAAKIRVEQAIFRNIPIIPCISGRLKNYAFQIDCLAILKKHLGENNYLHLCKTLNDNARALFHS